ncbi:PAS domain S-box protein [Elusimicrobiota bacterium]
MAKDRKNDNRIPGSDKYLLKKSDERFRSLVEHASEALFCYEYDPPIPIDAPVKDQIPLFYNGVLAECNDIAARSYGTAKAEEVIGKKLTELFGTSTGSLDAFFRTFIENGYRTQNLESKEILEDGTERYFLNNGHGVIENGRLTRVWGTYRDITQQKQIEDKLKQSEKKYRNLFDNIPIGIFRTTPDAQIIDFNHTMLELLEYPSRQALMEKKVSDLYVDPKDRQLLIDTLKRDGFMKNFETRFCKYDGAIIWAEGHVTIINEDSGDIIIEGGLIDITERKKAEELLKKSEELYRNIIEHTNEMFFIVGPAADIVFITPQAEDIIGYKPWELMKIKWIDLLTDNPENDKGKKIAQDVFKKSVNPQLHLMEVYHKNGNRVLLEIDESPVFDDKGKVVFLSGAARDITERKRIEEAFVKEKEFTDSALDNQLDTFFLFDPATGKALRWNRIFSDITGYSDKEIAELKMPDSYYSAEDLKRTGEFIQVVLKKGTGTIELDLICKDGRNVPTEYKVSVINDDQGQPKYFISIGRDITERRKAEEEMHKLALAVKYSSELVNLGTLDGKMIFINDSGGRILGIDPAEVGQISVMDVIPDHFKELVQNEVIPKLLQGETWEGELQYRNIKTGDLTDVHAMTFTVPDPETGKPQFLANVSMDITARKSAEIELKKSRDQLRKLATQLQKTEELERKALSRELHDQVGQNLTALNINLNMLKNQISGGLAKEAKNRINDSMNLVENTVKSIRNIMGDLRPQELDDYGLSAALRWYIKRFQDRTAVSVNLKEGKKLSRLPASTESALFRIFQEALTNVAKHADASEVNLIIREDDGIFRFTIDDNGNGFDIGTDPNSKEEGGWGIINMKERALAIGADIDIKSEPGSGTNITLKVKI